MMPSRVLPPIFLQSIRKMPYPSVLVEAFLLLFDPYDVMSFYPPYFYEGQNVVFHVVNITNNHLHRFDFMKSNFLLNEFPGKDDVETVSEFLMEIEEVLHGDSLLDRLNFIEHRAKDKDEYVSMLKFYNYLRGTDAYSPVEMGDGQKLIGEKKDDNPGTKK